MIKFELKILPDNIEDDTFIQNKINKLYPNWQSEYELILLKKSIDARRQPILYVLQYQLIDKKEFIVEVPEFRVSNSKKSKKIVVVGAGPAGLFACLQLLENGNLPILIERGKNIKDRRRDLAALNKELVVNPESNYCFGEGGAGTYSDGKLYTRSKKRGDVKKVLSTFVKHGAKLDILTDAHPHIGTNKLPGIIESIRNFIIENGGEIRFNSKLTNLRVIENRICEIEINNSEKLSVDELILATGHSARDIFYLLNKHAIIIEAKPFALGVRIEHPQALIDEIQYKCELKPKNLPPSSYGLVTQSSGHGVFSFCMCPGGIIAPASTNINEVVVNGWSPSKRNGFFANSGMVVSVDEKDWSNEFGSLPLSGLNFQEKIEQNAFLVNQSIVAPAQRMDDFIQNKISSHLPNCSYIPGVSSFDIKELFPKQITESLKNGLIDFGKKMKGYRTNEAILVGVESRTSSPVRIPRNKDTLRHIQIENLFPCGEGAGYAGGIVSAALDGMACANGVL